MKDQKLEIKTINCEDCGLSYQEFGIDTTLPNAQWLAVHPEGVDGILCANCMVKRASNLPEIISAKMTFVFACDFSENELLEHLN